MGFSLPLFLSYRRDPRGYEEFFTSDAFYRNGLCLLYEAAVTFTLPSKAKRKLIDKSPIKNVNLWGIGNILVSMLTG